MQAGEVHAYEMQAREVHAYKIQAHETHAREMHGYKVYNHEVCLMKCCQTFGCLGNRKPGLRLGSGRIYEMDELVFCLPEKNWMSIYVHSTHLLAEAA
jgi:hypothetical protein